MYLQNHAGMSIQVTLRMMQGYLVGNHLTDAKAFWTSEPITDVDGPWSGGKQ